MPPIGTRALEKKNVRPIAPAAVAVEVPLRAADGDVHACRAAAQADPARLRVAFQKLTVGKAGDDCRVGVHDWLRRWHEQ